MTTNLIDDPTYWQWPNRHERLLDQLADATSRKQLYENWLKTSQCIYESALVQEWQLTMGWALLGWPGIDRKIVKERISQIVASMPINTYLPSHIQKSPQLTLPIKLD